jgi:predicted kinase
MRDVHLVVGAPCAGKSWFVAENAEPGDLIVDWNLLAQEAGSPVAHDHDQFIIPLANAARKRLEAEVAESGDITAWVIRTAPSPRDQQSIMRRLRATELITVDPGMEECLRRSRDEGRPPDVDQAIVKWYGMYYGARIGGAGSLPLSVKDPRHTPEWRKITALVRRAGGPCAICGNPIRYDKKKPDPLSFSVDHIIPWSMGGAPYDLNNCRPAHYGCNASKGNRPEEAGHRVSEAY